MGIGIVLVVLGAILAFAVRRDSPVVDLQVVGLILIAAGAAVIYLARRGSTRVHERRTVEDLTDPERPVRSVHDSVTVQDSAPQPDPMSDGTTGD